MHVPGRTFPVDIRYLEDAVEYTKWSVAEGSPYARRRESTLATITSSHLYIQSTINFIRGKSDQIGQRKRPTEVMMMMMKAIARARI